jgi:hypothetical protein
MSITVLFSVAGLLVSYMLVPTISLVSYPLPMLHLIVPAVRSSLISVNIAVFSLIHSYSDKILFPLVLKVLSVNISLPPPVQVLLKSPLFNVNVISVPVIYEKVIVLGTFSVRPVISI